MGLQEIDLRQEARIFGKHHEDGLTAIGQGIERGLIGLGAAMRPRDPVAMNHLPCPTDCGIFVDRIDNMSFVDGWATQCAAILDHLKDAHGAVIGGRP